MPNLSVSRSGDSSQPPKVRWPETVRHPTHYLSECGHAQPGPTDEEIDGCPEIVVRRCAVCERELWWNVNQWRAL